MKLLTHNMLMCHKRNCVKGGRNFPLRIRNPELANKESEFNLVFWQRMVPKIHWGAILSAAADVGFEGLPEDMPVNAAEDTEFLQRLHTLLSNIQILEGALVCGDCGREYPIAKGVPNMLLNEDEL